MKAQYALSLLALLVYADAFVPLIASPRSCHSSTILAFGLPSFLTPASEEDSTDAGSPSKKTSSKREIEASEKKIDLKGVLQLITAGAGAPFLGDFEGVDDETGNFMFSLEANNLVDEEGNSKQTAMPYFENGWVDPEDEKKREQGFRFPWSK